MATRLPRTQPLAVREDQCVREARELLVFLPGVFDVVEDYEAYGFLRAVRETGRAVDMLLVDAHLGYYAARTVLERLRQDVIVPARARYESICLIGISMGGLGALLPALLAVEVEDQPGRPPEARRRDSPVDPPDGAGQSDLGPPAPPGRARPPWLQRCRTHGRQVHAPSFTSAVADLARLSDGSCPRRR
jgi:hypothetical protein